MEIKVLEKGIEIDLKPIYLLLFVDDQVVIE